MLKSENSNSNSNRQFAWIPHTVMVSAAVRITLYFYESAKWSHSGVSITTLKGFILFTAACESATIQGEWIVAFWLQQWSREHVTLLRYTYIVCLFVTLFRGNVSAEWVLLFLTAKIFRGEMVNSLRGKENAQLVLKVRF